MKAKAYAPAIEPTVLESISKPGYRQSPSSHFQNMINQNLPIIERQCFKTIKQQLKNLGLTNNPLHVENEALELSNQVLDTLKQDDYHVLRQFKGQSLLSTYITTIIARHAVDILRKKLGRNREKERAQKFGDLGIWTLDKINHFPDCTPQELFQLIKKETDSPPPPHLLETIFFKIKNKNQDSSLPLPNDAAVKEATSLPGNDTNQWVAKDPRNNPEEEFLVKEKQQHLGTVLHDIIDHLDGQERLILRIRFPLDENQPPGKIDDLANLLGIKPKAVYKRIDRILNKCRLLLKQKGVSIHDLF